MRSVAVAALLIASASAAAAPVLAPVTPGHGVRAVVEIDADPHATGESPYLYLDRCTGGCEVRGAGTNDAANLISTIPQPGTYLVGEFANDQGQTGSAADAEWAQLVQCVQEVYSPFALTVTDQPPTGVQYTEALVAGLPANIGQASDILGIANISSNCSPVNNTIAFVFANAHPGEGSARVYDICWTAAQESAHAFGLDHEYQFTDGESACRDPMTYRTDCGGEKFFRDLQADCGEYSVRACRCSATQNSAALIESVFGAGTPITAPPHVAITSPATGTAVAPGASVHATAGAQRGVAEVELFINGSRYAYTFMVAAFGPDGQPDSDYGFDLPAVPIGTLNIVVRAIDDLGMYTDSAPIAMTNGSDCTSADQCLANQSCASGLCVYPAPTAKLGQACTYDQACTTWECVGGACTTECESDQPGSCPSPLACESTGGTSGQCVASTGGGCCDADAGRASPWSAAILAALVVAVFARQRAAATTSRR